MAIAGIGGGGSASRVNVELFFLLLSEDTDAAEAAPLLRPAELCAAEAAPAAAPAVVPEAEAPLVSSPATATARICNRVRKSLSN